MDFLDTTRFEHQDFSNEYVEMTIEIVDLPIEHGYFP